MKTNAISFYRMIRPGLCQKGEGRQSGHRQGYGRGCDFDHGEIHHGGVADSV